MSLQVELVGEPVLIQGHLFFKSAPAPEFGIGDGVFYRSDGADWLIAPWGASDPAEDMTSEDYGGREFAEFFEVGR